MKKHLSTALRVVVAALGVAYIVWMVDLADHVELPAGTVLADGGVLDGSTSCKVIAGVYDAANPSGQLQVRVKRDGLPDLTVDVDSATLDVGPGGPRFVPGLVTMLRQSDKPRLLLGLLMVSVIYPILVVRWWLLMRTRGMDVTMWKAFRLTMVGNFFNFCIPGTTGGDLVKAYYAAKGSGRRADAVMTVIVDRVCGLLGLLMLAGLAGLFMLHDDVARQITAYIWLIWLGILLGSCVYFSRRLRALLRVDRLLSLLPAKGLLGSIDEAAMAYRGHLLVVAGVISMGVVLHLMLVCATATAGYALGMDSSIGLLLIVIPVTFLVGAVPIAPQGLGVMEVFAVTMLNSPLASPNQIIGMLMMVRAYQLAYSLLGSVFLLKGEIHLHPQEPVPQVEA